MSIYVAGPGHGGPGMVANTYLEGTYSEVLSAHPAKRRGHAAGYSSNFLSRAGFPATSRRRLPARFTKAGNWAIRSLHAYGAAFDNPDLLVCCVVGDGEAETGPLATSWHSNKFLNPARDGAVLPILHLNGYKIANPTVLGRMNDEELTHLFTGYGYKPYFVEGHEPEAMHQLMAHTLDTVVEEIHAIQEDARERGSATRAVRLGR